MRVPSWRVAILLSCMDGDGRRLFCIPPRNAARRDNQACAPAGIAKPFTVDSGGSAWATILLRKCMCPVHGLTVLQACLFSSAVCLLLLLSASLTCKRRTLAFSSKQRRKRHCTRKGVKKDLFLHGEGSAGAMLCLPPHQYLAAGGSLGGS